MIALTTLTWRKALLQRINFWFFKDIKYGIYGDIKFFFMTSMVKIGLRKEFESWECPEKAFDLDF